MTLPTEEAPANSVPAAAVIRRVQALIGITGRKGHVGGSTFSGEEIARVTLPTEEAPANSVPAAAVIRRVQALIGITGRKGHVGG